MQRLELQKLAICRIDDAVLLLKAKRYGAAYYLSGYAVELGFKACIARQFIAEDIPEKRYVDKIYSHQFGDLVGLAGLKLELKNRQDSDSRFQAFWGIVSEWNVDSRYAIIEPAAAQLLLVAVTHPEHGVFPWIQTLW